MVAADKYVAMWPPTPEPLSNACSTIATAFPADDVGETGLQFDVAGILRLVFKVDGVLVGRVEGGLRHHHPLAA